MCLKSNQVFTVCDMVCEILALALGRHAGTEELLLGAVTLLAKFQL